MQWLFFVKTGDGWGYRGGAGGVSGPQKEVMGPLPRNRSWFKMYLCPKVRVKECYSKPSTENGRQALGMTAVTHFLDWTGTTLPSEKTVMKQKPEHFPPSCLFSI